MQTPTPTPRERAEAYESRPARSRTSYDWDLIVIGQWQEWQNMPAATKDEAEAAYLRLRGAARSAATRRGLKVETRKQDYGRVVDLLFTKDPGAGA